METTKLSDLQQAAVARVTAVPGTGLGCRHCRVVPSKRVKAWHRKQGGGTSLKWFARGLAATTSVAPADVEQRAMAKTWLASKGCRR